MKSALDHVIHSVLRKDEDPINILYFGYDGWFESMISKIPNTKFYVNKDYLQYPLDDCTTPYNFTILDKGMTYIPNRIDIDIVICNSRREQVNHAATIAAAYHLPCIFIDHELPNSNTKSSLREYVNSRLPKSCIHVCTSSIIVDEWILDKDTIVVPYDISSVTIDKPKTQEVLVVGDYEPQDQRILDIMLNAHPDAKGIGNSKSLKKYDSYESLMYHMSNSKVCIMCINENRPPILAMMAMAAGCIVIINNTRWTTSIINHGDNGFIFDKANDIPKYVKLALSPESCIDTDYTPHNSTNTWLSLVQDSIKGVYLR